jgi:hypothetical protein
MRKFREAVAYFAACALVGHVIGLILVAIADHAI